MDRSLAKQEQDPKDDYPWNLRSGIHDYRRWLSDSLADLLADASEKPKALNDGTAAGPATASTTAAASTPPSTGGAPPPSSPAQAENEKAEEVQDSGEIVH